MRPGWPYGPGTRSARDPGARRRPACARWRSAAGGSGGRRRRTTRRRRCTRSGRSPGDRDHVRGACAPAWPHLLRQLLGRGHERDVTPRARVAGTRGSTGSACSRGSPCRRPPLAAARSARARARPSSRRSSRPARSRPPVPGTAPRRARSRRRAPARARDSGRWLRWPRSRAGPRDGCG